ncbi:OLC1v1025787C2 [Oldenlandia corymbosa var. corymbosa]|nr:OLC1v1025787C2 [Oldenlandia corymbosa var. corymbosa]
MAKQRGSGGVGSRVGGGAGRRDYGSPSPLTRAVNSVMAFVRFAEFEILFVLFFVIAYIIFKDLTSRPEYNQILVKKPGGPDWWPY